MEKPDLSLLKEAVIIALEIQQLLGKKVSVDQAIKTVIEGLNFKKESLI